MRRSTTMTASPPWWVSLSSSAIRTLPFGRYQLANAVARWSTRPFLARMPRDLGGSAFICDLNDTIAREVCFTGRYEPQETQLAMRLLKPGMIVVDVGANWGYFTLACAHLVGNAGRVIALEPHPRLSTMLANNVETNHLSQVEVLRLAAGASAGARSFVGFDEHGGNWGLSRAAQPTEAGDFECPSATIDRVLDERGVARVDLVKMDIEGAEAEAIPGMADGLFRHRYRVVLLECHPAQIAALGSSLERSLDPFRRAGYRGWHIVHSQAMHRRAAAGPVPTSDLLVAIDPSALVASLRADPWPHLLWTAPGETLPA
jgi:FkbM family methyltransferase